MGDISEELLQNQCGSKQVSAVLARMDVYFAGDESVYLDIIPLSGPGLQSHHCIQSVQS